MPTQILPDVPNRWVFRDQPAARCLGGRPGRRGGCAGIGEVMTALDWTCSGIRSARHLTRAAPTGARPMPRSVSIRPAIPSDIQSLNPLFEALDEQLVLRCQTSFESLLWNGESGPGLTGSSFLLQGQSR